MSIFPLMRLSGTAIVLPQFLARVRSTYQYEGRRPGRPLGVMEATWLYKRVMGRLGGCWWGGKSIVQSGFGHPFHTQQMLRNRLYLEL